MLRVEALGDGDVAFLQVPAQDDLRGGFAVFGGELGQDGFFEEFAVAVAERIPAFEGDAGALELCFEFVLVSVGVNFDLQYGGRDVGHVEDFLDFAHGEVG